MSLVHPQETPLEVLVHRSAFVVAAEPADPPAGSVRVFRRKGDPLEVGTRRFVVREILNTPDGPIRKPKSIGYASWLSSHPAFDKETYARLSRTPPPVGETMHLLPEDVDDRLDPRDSDLVTSEVVPVYRKRGPDVPRRALFLGRHYGGHWNCGVHGAEETDLDEVRRLIAHYASRICPCGADLSEFGGPHPGFSADRPGGTCRDCGRPMPPPASR